MALADRSLVFKTDVNHKIFVAEALINTGRGIGLNGKYNAKLGGYGVAQ